MAKLEFKIKMPTHRALTSIIQSHTQVFPGTGEQGERKVTRASLRRGCYVVTNKDRTTASMVKALMMSIK